MSSNNERSDAEVFVAKFTEKMFVVRYFFFLVCALPGIAGYFLKFDRLVYISTAVCVAVYLIIAYAYGRLFLGALFLGLAAAAGYLITGNSYTGACLGILVVFVIRHLLKALLYKFVRALIEASKHAT